MKEPYGKGLATRPGPESCAGHGNMTGEALTGVHAGQPLGTRKGVGESAGQNRQGVADERAIRERASDPSRPRVMRRSW
jgi:hypothetical protein